MSRGIQYIYVYIYIPIGSIHIFAYIQLIFIVLPHVGNTTIHGSNMIQQDLHIQLMSSSYVISAVAEITLRSYDLIAEFNISLRHSGGFAIHIHVDRVTFIFTPPLQGFLATRKSYTSQGYVSLGKKSSWPEESRWRPHWDPIVEAAHGSPRRT